MTTVTVVMMTVMIKKYDADDNRYRDVVFTNDVPPKLMFSRLKMDMFGCLTIPPSLYPNCS